VIVCPVVMIRIVVRIVAKLIETLLVITVVMMKTKKAKVMMKQKPRPYYY